MLTAVVCIFISILQLVVIHLLVKPTNFYSSILHFFLIFPVIFNQLLPLSLDIITPGIGVYWGISLIHAYFVNFIYMTACVLIWRIYTKSYSDKYRARADVSTRLIFLITLLSILYNLLRVASLLKILDIDLVAQLFPFNDFLMNLFKVSPFAILYGCLRHLELSRSLRMFVYFSVVVYFISVIPTGHRSSIIFPAILMLFYINRSGIIKKTLIASVLLVIFAPFADLYKSFRLIYSPDSNISSMEHSSTTFVEEVYFRFRVNNDISAGISTIISENSSPVGWAPLTSAFGSIIPASLYEGDKPWPGSVDGTNRGVLSRIANNEVYQAPHNMSEYMYPLHPVWEFGYFYYLINIILSAFGVLAVERLSIRFGDRIFLLPIVGMLPFSYSYTFTPIVIYLQQLSYVLIPGLFLLVCIYVLRGLGRLKLYHKNLSIQEYVVRNRIIK